VTWGRIRCTCGRWFNARSEHPAEGTHLSARQVILLCLLLALGHDNQTIAYYVGVSSETVRCWRKELGHA
jgi:DNA-binding NarL/FixJ family response regulator